MKVFAYDGVEIRACTLQDISLDGAYIKTKDFALPNNTNLEVILNIRRGGKPTHCRLPANVVRVRRDGMAVVFGELSAELCNILLDIVTPPE